MTKMFTAKLLVLSAVSCWMAATASAATIQFTVTPLASPGQFRYTYTVSGITFQQNQDFDIQFPAALYTGLTNAMVGAGFDSIVLQPNNPPGAGGDFIALALVNNPSLAGPFSIDFTYLGAGAPGAQDFTIDQYDANGNFIRTDSSGVTSLAGGSAVPEPSAFFLSIIGLVAGGVCLAARRRSSRLA